VKAWASMKLCVVVVGAATAGCGVTGALGDSMGSGGDDAGSPASDDGGAEAQGVTTQGCARGGAPTLLATSPQSARDIASDGERVYWSTWGSDATQNNGMIVSAPARGGQTAVLAQGEGTTMQVMVDADRVYWLDYGKSLRAVSRRPGAAPVTLAAPDEPGPMAYAIDRDRAYYTTTGGVWSVALTGGTPVKLADAPADLAIAADDAYVYWTERKEASLLRVAKDGGAVQTVSSGAPWLASSEPMSLVVDAARVYWLANDAGALLAADKGGGGPAVVKAGLHCPITLRIDGASLFFANDGVACAAADANPADRAIDRIPVRGGAVARVGDAHESLDGAFALDAYNVYWAGRGGPEGVSGVWCAAR
jgi:hypothetical protein